MIGTMESRFVGGHGYAEQVFWAGKSHTQVRDDQYPGAKIEAVGPAPKRSLRVGIQHCQLYRLTVDAMIVGYLVEVA